MAGETIVDEIKEKKQFHSPPFIHLFRPSEDFIPLCSLLWFSINFVNLVPPTPIDEFKGPTSIERRDCFSYNIYLRCSLSRGQLANHWTAKHLLFQFYLLWSSLTSSPAWRAFSRPTWTAYEYATMCIGSRKYEIVYYEYGELNIKGIGSSRECVSGCTLCQISPLFSCCCKNIS